MSRKIYLHVGLPKCGSTSIQRYCANVRQELQSLGYLYPILRLPGLHFDNHSIAVLSQFNPKSAWFIRKKYRYLPLWMVKAVLRNQLSGHLSSFDGNLVISGELISAMPKPTLCEFHEYLSRHCDHVEVIVYIRDPLEFTESLSQERLKDGQVLNLGNIPKQPCAILSRVWDVFRDSIRIHNFRSAQEHEFGPPGYFLETIGIPIEKVPKSEGFSANARFSAVSMRLMAHLNSRHPLPDANSKYKERLLRSRFALRSIEGPK